LGVVKNPEDAEDISQEVFLSVFKNLDKFREESNIYTWIYKIAINKIYDFFRKRKETLELNEEILMSLDDNKTDTKLILEERMKGLSPLERQIILLKDIFGYKLKEIAELQNMNISTVKSIYYKAIKSMGGN
jgi:RNA polymerase sigma-70 factor (ECF subfamily)